MAWGVEMAQSVEHRDLDSGIYLFDEIAFSNLYHLTLGPFRKFVFQDLN